MLVNMTFYDWQVASFSASSFKVNKENVKENNNNQSLKGLYLNLPYT